MELRDEEIVKKCLNGDRSAYAWLVDRYQQPVFAFIYRLVGQREEAEDLAQEAFIRAYASLSRYNPAYKFSTWLYQIAKNLSLDYLRRKKPVPAPADETLAAPGDGPEGEYIAAETRATLRQAIGQLPAQQRLCLILYHYQGLSYSEVAKRLQLPLPTVKTALFRGRQKLRSGLTAKGGETDGLC